MLLLAAFLVGLGVFAIFVDGLLLSMRLKNLDADLRLGAPLLSEDQLQKLTTLPSAVATRRKVRLLRWIIPTTYILFAMTIALLGYPSEYR
jgi:hypothetical protein